MAFSLTPSAADNEKALSGAPTGTTPTPAQVTAATTSDMVDRGTQAQLTAGTPGALPGASAGNLATVPNAQLLNANAPTGQNGASTGTPDTSTNLAQYYSGQGQALPSLQARATLYQSNGLGTSASYQGTAAQNTALLNALKGPAKSSFQTGFNNANANGAGGTTGTDVPQDTGTKAVTDYAPQTGGQSDLVLQSNAAHQQYLNDYAAYQSSQNQQQSLVQQYQTMSQQLGIPALDTQLLNMKTVMDGSEQDIRDEITKAGGFATNSQVLALTDARNKTMITNYNNLLQTRNNMQNNLTTMMGLSEQDRAAASAQIDKQLNFDTQQETYADKMLSNAQDSLKNSATTMGWNGILQAAVASGDPQAIARINSTMGPGFDLQAAANKETADKATATTFSVEKVGGRDVRFGFDKAGNVVSKVDLGASSSTPTTPTTPKFDYNSAVSNLKNVGVPVKSLNTNGTIASAYNKQLLDDGLSTSAINWLWGEVTGGTSFEDIRQALRGSGVDPSVLDTFVQTLQK